MPLILAGPLTVAAMIGLGVRARRPAANLALAAPIVALLGCLLALWARFGHSDPYDASYEWINVTTAFSGPPQFQNYVAAVGLRASHLTMTLALAAIAITVGVLIWSRSRRLAWPGRHYALLTLLFACALGVIFSTDLVELYVFWGVAGVSSYLLLSHSWGEEDSTRAGRLALAVPALTDMCLLAGIAILYSRYGQLNVDQLIPTVGHTAGAGPRALATACVLIFLGAGGRLGLFPFQSWLTAASGSPPAALAAVEGLWPVMVAGLLVKVMPILVSANSLPFRFVAAAAAASALLLPLRALATSDVRRIVTSVGIGLSALGVLAFVRPSAVAPAALLLSVTGICRAAAVLSTGTLVSGLRSAELGDLGEGFGRLRLTTLALALAGAGLVVGTGEVAGENLRPLWAAVYGIALLLGTVALFRLYFIAGHGLLPRRRGFDPERVRAPIASLAYPPLLLAGVGLLAAISFFLGHWLTFLDHRPHATRSPLATMAWLLIPLAGVAIASVLFLARRDLGQRVTLLTRRAWSAGDGYAAAAGRRWLAEPALGLSDLAEERLLAGGETGLADSMATSANLVRPPIAISGRVVASALIVMVLIVGAALLGSGVGR